MLEPRLNKNNTSGQTGVHWDAKRAFWITKITIKNKSIFLGRYKLFEDAKKAREKAKVVKNTLENIPTIFVDIQILEDKSIVAYAYINSQAEQPLELVIKRNSYES